MSSMRVGRRAGLSGTRAAIEETARILFAQAGYAKTSVRAIARAAEVDPALVRHFFGTKAQLFQTVIQFPVDPAQVVRHVIAGSAGEAGGRLAEVVADLVRDDGRSALAAALFRTAATEPGVATLVGEALLAQIAQPITNHLAVEEPELRAALISTQVMGFVTATRIAALTPLGTLSRTEIIALLAPPLQHYLSGDLRALFPA